MKAIKYIGQILASLIYTPIYTVIIYYAMIFSFLFAISLPTFWMIVVFVFIGGIIEALIYMLHIFGLLPFAWIVKENKTSLITSVTLCVLMVIYLIVCVWMLFLDYGIVGIIAAVIITGMLLQFMLQSAIGIIGLSSDD